MPVRSMAIGVAAGIAALWAASVCADTAIGDWGHFVLNKPRVLLNDPDGRAFTVTVHVMRWAVTNWNAATFKVRLSGPDGTPIVTIHGGGWGAGDPSLLAPHCRYFSSRGLVAVNVEYRLVSKGSTVRIADCVADCRDAIRFVRESAVSLGIDPERIAVAGAVLRMTDIFLAGLGYIAGEPSIAAKP